MPGEDQPPLFRSGSLRAGSGGRGRCDLSWPYFTTACLLGEPQATVGHQWLNTKYSWVKHLGDMVSRLRTRARVVIAIEVGPENR